ncbi:chaperone j-domain-containing protein [Stemphylium lycopersici]|uniref:Chaperone j-domain-containing protein n=1 Tax=Stemphylium lycopersici TaxID=183478 RepID=A0A364NAF6_STELY|nr:chaperone j-domain-containing protein [Stemphylium lycopersici]
MLSKKSSILLSSSYTNLGPLYHSHTANSSSSSSSRHARQPRQSCRHTFSRPCGGAPRQQRRTYAQHHDASACSRDEGDLLRWPEPEKPHKTPTPYQILRCSKGDAYTKHRFYALVKLYHPDRGHVSPAIAQLPLHVRLERYRMLVTAHDILSDIEKRKAYDAWGHGWAGHHGTPMAPRHSDWDYDPRRWKTDPRTNATWEDWERWHYENSGGKDSDARTVQMSNFTFMALIFAFVSIGGVVQGTRFSTFNNSVIERRDQIHREASMEYSRSRNATMSASGDRDERIRTFLEHRESTIVGEHSYQRLLPPADNCSPDEVRRQ